MKVIRKAPDLVFTLDKKKVLAICKKIEMEPGYTSIFIDEVNKAIINNQNGRMIEHVKPEPGCTVKYDNVTVQKVAGGPGFAIISFKDGVVIDPNAEEVAIAPVQPPVEEAPAPEPAAKVEESVPPPVVEEAIKVTAPVADPVVPESAAVVEEKPCTDDACTCEEKKEPPQEESSAASSAGEQPQV